MNASGNVAWLTMQGEIELLETKLGTFRAPEYGNAWADDEIMGAFKGRPIAKEGDEEDEEADDALGVHGADDGDVELWLEGDDALDSSLPFTAV